MNKIKIILLILLLIGLGVLAASVYTIDEREQVVITQFRRPVRVIKEPGVHFKLPFIQEINRFEDRIMQWDGESSRIPTEDKRYIWIDTTARWKIADPLKFMQSFPTAGAQTRLSDILKGKTQEVIPKHRVIEIVRSSNRIVDIIKSTLDSELSKAMSEADNLSKYDDQSNQKERKNKIEKIREGRGRDFVRNEIFERAKPIIAEYGIELIDIRIKRFNYDRDVRNEVYKRMRSERERASSLFRSEGEGRRAQIEGLKIQELQRIQSEATWKGQTIKGKADAEAMKIYADAYSKDPDYYAFLLSLESYKETLANNTTLILATDNEYLKYLKQPREEKNTP
ncbi:MAG: protease modulator HflC [Candidatus Aureabacteria bacterium]|nr:protease modulator HflC [Candidatus Auribacterota bacterium]